MAVLCLGGSSSSSDSSCVDNIGHVVEYMGDSRLLEISSGCSASRWI